MNILIDTSPLKDANAVRGVGRYTKELISALKTLDTPHAFFTNEDRPARVDLVHYPFFDFFFATLPLIKKAKTIVTLHDVIPLVMSKHYPRGIRGEVKFLHQKTSLSGVSQIITDSLVSKRDIADHLKVKADKITVVPLAASPEFKKLAASVVDEVRRKYEIPKHYCLYVGDISYNKNLPFLITAISRIPNLTLVLVGRQMKNNSIPEGKAIEAAIKQTGSERRVHRVDNVDSQADLVALYSGASCYIQPSLYEGFGLPVLEAMRCKVPVVSSCGGSLPEVVGEYGLQFYPTSLDECEAAVRKTLRLSEAEKHAQVNRAYEYSSAFTWERTARETLAVYEKVNKQ